LHVPAGWTPVIRVLWVCVLYVAIPLVAAYLVFLRRDFAEE
jgi:ABC-type transport system involved in multi-copper enzyme maturation permease subunit